MRRPLKSRRRSLRSRNRAAVSILRLPSLWAGPGVGEECGFAVGDERQQTRRAFLRSMVMAGAACAAPCGVLGRQFAVPELHEAAFYESLDGLKVQCGLCPKRCVVPEGGRGYCGVRENRGGKYYTLVYGRPVAIHNDSIEKKPFTHVYPGSKALSISTVGCNFKCKFCQNWSISQARPDDVMPRFVRPSDIAAMAVAKKARTVAFTPTTNCAISRQPRRRFFKGFAMSPLPRD